MNEPNDYLEDPLAIAVVQYLAAKNQIDGSKWIAPKQSGISAAAQAVANVQARADQRRREQAEAEIAKVLETRDIKDLLRYHLTADTVDIGDEPVSLGSADVAEELQRLLDGDD